MIKPMVSADMRVERALSTLTHPVPDDVRDLMVSLVRDAEMDCGIAALIEAMTAEAIADGIFMSAARKAMSEFNRGAGDGGGIPNLDGSGRVA